MITPQSASIIWEALPLVTLAGTNAFAVWKWRKAQHSRDLARDMAAYQENEKDIFRRTYETQRDAYFSTNTALGAADLVIAEQRDRMVAAEDQLRAIKLSRHNAAVKARQAQLSQQRAKVPAKASELTPVPVDTRKAA